MFNSISTFCTRLRPPPWRRVRFAVTALAVTLLAACTRSVSWEEEVPLNTGETIVVKRSGTYSFDFNASSGHIGFSPDWRSTIEFTYKGKKYSHTSEAFINLLAIAPNSIPNLVADARAWGNQHSYPCVTPYYVQFKPDETGKVWTWPSQVEPWLFNLPTNLLVGLVDISDDGRKLSPDDRKRINGSLLGMSPYQRIDPFFKPENCVRSH